MFEVGCQVSPTEPLVVASTALEEHPWPPGVRLREVDLGSSNQGSLFQILAESEAAVSAVLSPIVLSRLASFAQKQAKKWQLVLDPEGMVGAVEAPPATFSLRLYSKLPTAEATLAEIDRVQAALDLIDSLIEGQPLTPRPLQELAGSESRCAIA